MKTDLHYRQNLVRTVFLGLSLVFCILSTGCLSIGGRQVTYNCERGKHAEERIAVLEDRIKVLEHYAGITPPTSRETTVSVAGLTTEASVLPQAPLPLHVTDSRVYDQASGR